MISTGTLPLLEISLVHICLSDRGKFGLYLFSLPTLKTETVSIAGRWMFARTLGRARLFTPMNSSCAKMHQSVARLLRQPIHGFCCGTQTHLFRLFSLATKVYDAKCFFVASPERNATAT